MITWLENLRRAPEGRKARVAFALALSGAFVIFVFWAIAFGASAIAEFENAKNSQSASPITGMSETFSKAFEGMSGAANSISQQLNQIQENLANAASSSIQENSGEESSGAASVQSQTSSDNNSGNSADSAPQ